MYQERLIDVISSVDNLEYGIRKSDILVSSRMIFSFQAIKRLFSI